MSAAPAPVELAGLRVAVTQTRAATGDLAGNVERILAAAVAAHAAGADLLVTPAFAVTGPRCGDLFGDPAFLADAETALADLARRVPLPVVVGTVARQQMVDPAQVTAGHRDDPHRPAVSVVALLAPGHRPMAHVARTPVSRFFAAGAARQPLLPVTTDRGGVARSVALGVVTGRDLDRASAEDTADWLVASGAQLIVAPTADFYRVGSGDERTGAAHTLAAATGLDVVYANGVGGADEVVYDGSSFAVTADGHVLPAGGFCAETTVVVGDGAGHPAASPEAEVYRVLVRGLADYVHGNGFTDVVLGLSGGIDSALVAAIAVDALGAEHVHGLAMPGPYSSTGSVTDAVELARRLGMSCEVVDIACGYHERLAALDDVLAGTGDHAEQEPAGAQVARENLQARLRGLTLMTYANTHGHLLLSTGNKSEAAVGYFTLYGDACGTAPNPIADVYKTSVSYPDGTRLPGVYDLARWRNGHRPTPTAPVEPIPAETLTKAPSAELAPGQADTDSLPPYPVLDPLLHGYLELGASLEDLAGRLVAGGMAAGTAAALVERVVGLVARAEFKRRQGSLKLVVSRRAFGVDRTVPVTNAWTPSARLFADSR